MKTSSTNIHPALNFDDQAYNQYHLPQPVLDKLRVGRPVSYSSGKNVTRVSRVRHLVVFENLTSHQG